MRKAVLLSTVALVAGIGLASAQTMPSQEKSGTSGQAQSQTSGQAQPQRHEGSTAQQTREQPGQGRHEQGSAQNMPGKSGTAGQAQSQRNEGKAQREQTTGQNLEKQKPASRAEGNRERTTTGQGSQAPSQAQQSPAQQKQGQAQPKQGQAQHKEGQQGQQVQQGTQGRAGQHAQQPQVSPQQGQAATGAETQQPAKQGSNETAQQSGRAGNATVTLNESQRTHIQKTVFARSDVPRVDHVNFAVRVGTVVPESVHLVVVPQELVEIRPEWRDDMYFVTGDDIIIVDHSHRIVAIVAAGPTTAMSTETYSGYASARGSSVNMSSEEIRQVQIALNQKGFNVGEPDGILGSRTRQALIAFQKQQGFQASGHLDQQTFAALGISGKSGSNMGSSTTGSGQGSSSPSSATPSSSGQAGGGSNLPASKSGQAKPSGSSSTGQSNQSGMPSSSTSGQGGGKMNQPAQPSKTQGSGGTNMPNAQSK